MGGSPPGPPGHPWAYPMACVVVVVVVVVDPVEFERGSGPVSGFGCTRSLFGMHLCCFCVYFNSSGNIVSKTLYKRKVIHRTPRLFVVFWSV